MSMQNARTVLNSLSPNVDIPHPMAVEGTLHDYKRANDKKRGRMIVHYAAKGQVFFVKLDKESVKLV
jgi:penicillin V acylase-like amidase (Ntn superfamily)